MSELELAREVAALTTRCEKLERERDEARAAQKKAQRRADQCEAAINDLKTHPNRKFSHAVEAGYALAQRDLDLARGALAAQEERDIAAAESVGEPPFGCDTSQHLADLLADERAEMERLKRVVASMDDDLAARSREWAMEHGEDEDAVWTAVQFIEHYAASTGEGT